MPRPLPGGTVDESSAKTVELRLSHVVAGRQERDGAGAPAVVSASAARPSPGFRTESDTPGRRPPVASDTWTNSVAVAGCAGGRTGGSRRIAQASSRRGAERRMVHGTVMSDYRLHFSI